MLEEQTVLTDEQVDKLAKGDDAIKEMENEIQQLKNQFWSDNADKITGLLQWLIDNKDKVVTALTVIGGGFAALKMAEFAASLGQAMDGFKKLGLLGGAKGGAEKAVEQEIVGHHGTAGSFIALDENGVLNAEGIVKARNGDESPLFEEGTKYTVTVAAFGYPELTFSFAR